MTKKWLSTKSRKCLRLLLVERLCPTVLVCKYVMGLNTSHLCPLLIWSYATGNIITSSRPQPSPSFLQIYYELPHIFEWSLLMYNYDYCTWSTNLRLWIKNKRELHLFLHVLIVCLIFFIWYHKRLRLRVTIYDFDHIIGVFLYILRPY